MQRQSRAPGDTSTAQGHQRLPATPGTGREAWDRFSSQASECRRQSCEGIPFCCLSHQFMALCYSSTSLRTQLQI
jgi:hypothetical protein